MAAAANDGMATFAEGGRELMSQPKSTGRT
jgi:hypothetical protein